MAEIMRLPITNAVTGLNYTLPLSVGAKPQLVNLMLDTGSSMLVVDGRIYNPAEDTGVATTQLLQTAEFETGSVLAAVVRTAVGLTTSPGAPPTMLSGTDLTVTYGNPPGTFGQADGILGLGYASLASGFRMPADTWQNKYPSDRLTLGQPADIDPFVEQLVAAQRVTNKFSFAVRRSVLREALDDPATDPLNQGLFILGGGAECTDLYTGAFTSVAVVHEKYYNTNLIALQVGDRSIPVPSVPPGGRAGSNSIVDSGSTNVTLDPVLYSRLIALFRSVNPDLAQALEAYSPSVSRGVAQSQIDLTQWPPLSFIMQGSDGGQVAVTVQSKDYWQFDTGQAGYASHVLAGDNSIPDGQAILGLPLFADRFVVFDRTGTNGVIGFAARAENALIG